MTAAGSICPGARVRNGKCYLFGITPAGRPAEAKNEELRQRNAIPQLQTCARAPHARLLFRLFRRNYRPDGRCDFHSERPNLGNDPRNGFSLRMPIAQIIPFMTRK